MTDEQREAARRYRREWQKANPDKVRAYRRQFLATHPEYLGKH